MRQGIMIAAIAVGLAACSSGSPSPKVAALGTRATTTAAPTATGDNGGKPDLAKANAFSACMRSHGLPDFPDPQAGPGGAMTLQIKGGPGSDLGPDSPKFKAAQDACKSLLPNHGIEKPMTPEEQQKWLKWAGCIRAHGVPDFPDPQFSGGGVRVGSAGARIGPGDVHFDAAQEACKSQFPGLGNGRDTVRSGGGPG